MRLHKLLHLIEEVVFLGVLVFPFALVLAGMTGLASWLLDGLGSGLFTSGVLGLLTMAIVPLALRLFSGGPDTSAICELCIASKTILRPIVESKAGLEEKRRYPRYPLECATTFFNDDFNSFAIMTDISQQGCRIKSRVPVTAGDFGQLLINLPGRHTPLRVPKAVVRWAMGSDCGLEFLELEAEEDDLLSCITEACSLATG